MGFTGPNSNLSPTNYLAGFTICDIDTGADTKYYGFQSISGSWYIMRETTSSGTFRYAHGPSGYSAGWSGRAGLTYTLPDGG